MIGLKAGGFINKPTFVFLSRLRVSLQSPLEKVGVRRLVPVILLQAKNCACEMELWKYRIYAFKSPQNRFHFHYK